MELLHKNLDVVKRMINKDDKDFFMCVEGMEGVGKSTLAFQICEYVDKTFCVKRIVFDLDDFKQMVLQSKKGQAILIDEGAFMVFSRDFASRDTKELIKLFTAIRQYNLFICICVPKFQIIDKYLREHRVRAICRVMKRGRAFVYNRRAVNMIHPNKKYFGRWVYPTPTFKVSFPKYTGSNWEGYLKKKGKILDKQNDELITTGQAAKICGVTIPTIHHWFKNNKIDGKRTSNGAIRLNKQSVIDSMT